jgi:hypothetical protein
MKIRKKILRPALVLPWMWVALLAAPFVSTAADFEGTLTYEVQNNRENQEISFLVKGNRMAVESPANPSGIILIDRETMQAKVLMPRQKMYLEIPASRIVLNADEEAKGTFTVTGETREILGYTAKKVIYEEDGRTGEIWITDELGTFAPFQGPLGGERPPELINAFPNGGMPLEMRFTENGDNVVITVTEVTPKEVDDAEVEVPSDYRPLQMSGMPIPGMN